MCTRVKLQTIIICRFLAGILGSAPISNCGGQVSDMWSPRDRGLATAIYSMCTFFGPGISISANSDIISFMQPLGTSFRSDWSGFVSESLGNGWSTYWFGGNFKVAYDNLVSHYLTKPLGINFWIMVAISSLIVVLAIFYLRETVSNIDHLAHIRLFNVWYAHSILQYYSVGVQKDYKPSLEVEYTMQAFMKEASKNQNSRYSLST